MPYEVSTDSITCKAEETPQGSNLSKQTNNQKNTYLITQTLPGLDDAHEDVIV